MSVLRKQGTAGVVRGNVDYVVLKTPEGVFQVLRRDWALIAPFIQDGTFDRLCSLPIDLKAGLINHPIDAPGIPGRINTGSTARGEIPAVRGDELFYTRVLGILRGLFTEEFPTKPF